jgi:serine/threonine protein kinase/uncharacterized protein YegL
MDAKCVLGGRYKIIDELGRGGQAVVFLAFDQWLQRNVAIKRTNLLLLDESDRMRFLEEGRILAALEHPNIIPIYSLDVESDCAYLVMQHADQGSLRRLLCDSSGRLPIDRTIDLATALGEALRAVHYKGIIHGDFKPSNILLVTEAGTGRVVPKLGDFGIARHMINTPDTNEFLWGTLAYLPPEAILGREGQIGPRRDIYGLGAVIYESLVGYPPYGYDLKDGRQYWQPPQSPCELREGTPLWFGQVILRALSPSPASGYSTIVAMLEDLEEGKSPGGPAMPGSPPGGLSTIPVEPQPPVASSLSVQSLPPAEPHPVQDLPKTQRSRRAGSWLKRYFPLSTDRKRAILDKVIASLVATIIVETVAVLLLLLGNPSGSRFCDETRPSVTPTYVPFVTPPIAPIITPVPPTQESAPTVLPSDEPDPTIPSAEFPDPTIVLTQVPDPTSEPEPTVPTTSELEPTIRPTNEPEPTIRPTNEPEPTVAPTSEPEPTIRPTNKPEPTVAPTSEPEPTIRPTNKPEPTVAPTSEPEPTIQPTSEPVPTVAPTNEPEPTVAPTSEPEPTIQPTSEPEPTIPPTSEPVPTIAPTSEPEPTIAPTSEPEPTIQPTSEPEPTIPPTSEPEPTIAPTETPEPTPCSDLTIDIIIVIDVSGSMDGEKLHAAQAAAKSFIDAMRLETDQVGLVSFSHEATLQHPLTHDGDSVKEAIDALSAGGKTNMADGVRVAQEELEGPRHLQENVPVIILLSDGRSTTGGDPIEAAAVAKAAGTRIFTIGLGGDADEDTLRAMASSPDDYYFAPGPDDLAAIYDEIVRNVACAPSASGAIGLGAEGAGAASYATANEARVEATKVKYLRGWWLGGALFVAALILKERPRYLAARSLRTGS